MDSAFDKRGDATLPGSSLRNEAAKYLEAIYGNARLEIIVGGKKVDIVCQYFEHGKPTDFIVEVKDAGRTLQRKDVSAIYADYTSVLSQARAGKLLIVTRLGVAPGAQAFLDGLSNAFHQTIWELEDAALGLLPYVRNQVGAFDEEGLREYYIPARARKAEYTEYQLRSLSEHSVQLLDVVANWIDEPNAPPIAILGGYGAGKSSFAKRVVSMQAERALAEPAARRPILVKLGAITRSTGLDSLLGSLFTSEYEVRGYSFRRFCELNAKGRLLIILDGFDEMKHAMTWNEFINELAELNQLNAGESKVILLGRPSAFTSDDEHLEALRGRRRTDAGTRRLHNWPEFREYELDAFTRDERADFVTHFFSHMQQAKASTDGDHLDLESARSRAEDINRLADIEPEVFGKPVHARILVELALDPDFELASFTTGITRWSLYTEFYQLLARREMRRPARSPIDSTHRLEFLRRAALWLWRDRDGATSFRTGDLPQHILVDLPDGDTDNFEEKRREYLAGAFLERKSSDTYYFPHRSFAEFLVAEQLVRVPPTEEDHEWVDTLARDGVAEFISAAPASRDVAGWACTLTGRSGKLSIEYLLLLEKVAGDFATVATRLPENSPWLPLVRVFGTELNGHAQLQQIIADAILTAPAETVAFTLCGLARFYHLIPTRIQPPHNENPLPDLSSVVVTALISRVIGAVRETTPMARLTIDEGSAPFLTLLQKSVVLRDDEAGRWFAFSWPALADEAAGFNDRHGPALERSVGDYEYRTMDLERIPYIAVRNLLNREVSEFFHQFLMKRGTLRTISVVSHIERRASNRTEGPSADPRN